jgi:3-oxoacyl-[acyl-carrier-protein] synthase-3
MHQNIGILGIGAYLPPTIRRNEAWPAHIVDKWKAKKADQIIRADAVPEELLTDGVKRALAVLAELGSDPFQGAVERRVISEGMRAADMETTAAKEAIERAGITKDQIDFVFGYTMVPEYINVPSACIVHDNLGLREDCMSLNPDAVCNSFAMQMTLADSFIRTGRARYGLLTQSSACTRIAPMEESFSACIGDGATAVVVGPVAEGRGLLGFSHRTDGSLHKALVATVPGSHWYFYASHQATSWFRRVTQGAFQLEHAKTLDTFPWAGSLSAANLPMVLYTAHKEGLLEQDDLVATFCGGTGITYSSLVLRWGT